VKKSADRRNRLPYDGLTALVAPWGRPFGLPPAPANRLFSQRLMLTAPQLLASRVERNRATSVSEWSCPKVNGIAANLTLAVRRIRALGFNNGNPKSPLQTQGCGRR